MVNNISEHPSKCIRQSNGKNNNFNKKITRLTKNKTTAAWSKKSINAG